MVVGVDTFTAIALMWLSSQPLICQGFRQDGTRLCRPNGGRTYGFEVDWTSRRSTHTILYSCDEHPTTSPHAGVTTNRRGLLRSALSFGAAAAPALSLPVAPSRALLPLGLDSILPGGGSGGGAFETRGAFGPLPSTKKTDPSVGLGLLSFYDFSVGTGPTPEYGQLVRFQWAGYVRTAEGAPLVKFDSSVDRGKVLLTKHGSGRLCQGLEEGLHNMKVGGKRRIEMPLRFAYTEKGFYGPIPPDAGRRRTLAALLAKADPKTAQVVFDVHLLGAFDDDADPGYYEDSSLTPKQLAQVEAQIEAMKQNAMKPK